MRLCRRQLRNALLILLTLRVAPAQEITPVPAAGQAAPAPMPEAPTISHFIPEPSIAVGGPDRGEPKTTQRLRPAGLNSRFFGLIGPFHAPEVRPLFPGTGVRLNGLIHDDTLYLTLRDALALALENNLDVEVERYNLLLSETDLLRAKGGGSLRGIDYTVQEPPNGVGGPGSPLLNSTASNVNPTTPAVTDLTSLNSTTQVQTNLSMNGPGLTYAPGPSIPLFDPSLIATAGYFRRSNTVTLVATGGTGTGDTGSASGGTGSLDPARATHLYLREYRLPAGLQYGGATGSHGQQRLTGYLLDGVRIQSLSLAEHLGHADATALARERASGQPALYPDRDHQPRCVPIAV